MPDQGASERTCDLILDWDEDSHLSVKVVGRAIVVAQQM